MAKQIEAKILKIFKFVSSSTRENKFIFLSPTLYLNLGLKVYLVLKEYATFAI